MCNIISYTALLREICIKTVLRPQPQLSILNMRKPTISSLFNPYSFSGPFSMKMCVMQRGSTFSEMHEYGRYTTEDEGNAKGKVDEKLVEYIWPT